MSTSRKTCIDGSEQVVIKIVTAAEAASEEDGTYVLSTSRGCQSECANAQEEPELFELTISEAASIADEALVDITTSDPFYLFDYWSGVNEFNGHVVSESISPFTWQATADPAPIEWQATGLRDDGTSDTHGISIINPSSIPYTAQFIMGAVAAFLPRAGQPPIQDEWTFYYLVKYFAGALSEYVKLEILPINTGGGATSRLVRFVLSVTGQAAVIDQTVEVPSTENTSIVVNIGTNLNSITLTLINGRFPDIGQPVSVLVGTWNVDVPGNITSWLSDGEHGGAAIEYNRASASQAGFSRQQFVSIQINDETASI